LHLEASETHSALFEISNFNFIFVRDEEKKRVHESGPMLSRLCTRLFFFLVLVALWIGSYSRPEFALLSVFQTVGRLNEVHYFTATEKAKEGS
jgi:hypothetical protein